MRKSKVIFVGIFIGSILLGFCVVFCVRMCLASNPESYTVCYPANYNAGGNVLGGTCAVVEGECTGGCSCTIGNYTSGGCVPWECHTICTPDVLTKPQVEYFKGYCGGDGCICIVVSQGYATGPVDVSTCQ